MIVACWSGPRNISTALMRSWSSRQDTFVTDEIIRGSTSRTEGVATDIDQNALEIANKNFIYSSTHSGLECAFFTSLIAL